MRRSFLAVMLLVLALLITLYVVQSVGLLNVSISYTEGVSNPLPYTTVGTPLIAVLIVLMVILVAALLIRYVSRLP